MIMKKVKMPAINLKTPLTKGKIVQFEVLNFSQKSPNNRKDIEENVNDILKNPRVSSVVQRLSEI